VPYNVVERVCEAQVLPLAEELGIAVLAMEPLEKGRYVTGLRRAPDIEPQARFGVETWAQALLAWVISDGRITSAIPPTSRPERILEMLRLEIWGIFLWTCGIIYEKRLIDAFSGAAN